MGTNSSAPRWLWYATRTADCVPLDSQAYATTIVNRAPYPWPDWGCKQPDGGLHFNSSLASIDVKVAEPPSGKDEVTWTCEFQLFILSRAWFQLIEDLVDPEQIGVGRVLAHGRPLDEWVTIHGRRPPWLCSAEGWQKACPICGNPFTLRRGRAFFEDPAVLKMPLIVNDKGIFVREEEAARRKLPELAGAFTPLPVPFVPRPAG